jgi:hypothetical protein
MVTRTIATRTIARSRVTALMLAVCLASAVSATFGPSADAQSADPEMSCAPETVRAGGTTTCVVTGAPASTRVTIDVVRDGTVISQSSALAGTDGRATVATSVPSDATSGAATLTLRGTALTFPINVIPGAPTGVSAGLSPSVGEVERGVPAGVLLMAALLLAIGLARTSLVRSRAH